MEALRAYALTILVGALICGILLSMVQDGTHQALLRFLCGVFLTITLISPLMRFQWSPKWEIFQDILAEGALLAASGKNMADGERAQVITSQLEAYIWDKAAAMGADLIVTITLGENDLPARAELRGEVSEPAKRELSDMLERELGIAKENQLWTL